MTRATYVRLVAAMLVLDGRVARSCCSSSTGSATPASEQRGPIDTLFDVMIVLSCFVFAIVMVMFGYAIWKYRAKPGDESDGKPIHGNTRLEIAWTVIPTVIVLFGAAYSWVVLDDIEAKAAGPRCRSTSPASSSSGPSSTRRRRSARRSATPVTTNELHVPVDRQLDVTI